MAVGVGGGIEEIPRLIERKTEGLLFRLGHGGYYGPAINVYLGRLTKEPFLKKETDKGQALQRMEAMNTRQARAIRIPL